jgi:hypothetical protein
MACGLRLCAFEYGESIPTAGCETQYFSSALAGFQVIMYGRFWVITKAHCLVVTPPYLPDLLCWRRSWRCCVPPTTAPTAAPLAAFPVAAPIAAPAAAPLALLWVFCCFCWSCVFCWVCVCCWAGVGAGGVPGFGCVCPDAGGTIALVESAITNVRNFVDCFIWPPFRLLLFRSALRPARP